MDDSAPVCSLTLPPCEVITLVILDVAPKYSICGCILCGLFSGLGQANNMLAYMMKTTAWCVLFVPFGLCHTDFFAFRCSTVISLFAEDKH